ncbi:MAG: hypothetical protein VX112_04180 [Pseudomonadota bacterium]|nr:hypothetical protein [Pseudomonadota bacterium]
MTDQTDKALEYTTKIALFLCSQNMTLKDIFDKCNLVDIKAEGRDNQFNEKFPIFSKKGTEKPSAEEQFYADVRRVRGQHAEREGFDMILMTVLSLALIACIALIAFAPIIAGAIAGAIALSEFKKPLMIYFIADGVLGILRTVGLGMQYKLERIDDNRDLIEDYNIFTQSEFASIDDLVKCLPDDMKKLVKSLYGDIQNASNAVTSEDHFEHRLAMKNRANELMEKFASHHQGVRGWFSTWITGREEARKTNNLVQYNRDIGKLDINPDSEQAGLTSSSITTDTTVARGHNRSSENNKPTQQSEHKKNRL